jgi:hypothetical protein
VANGHPRHQLIHLPLRPQAQTTTAAAAISVEVIDGAEVSVGVVVAAYHLPLLTKHGPTALQMQGHPAEIETQLLQKSFCVARQDSNQWRKSRLTLQLPDTIKVTSPGTARIGVGAGLAPQLVQGLKLQCRIQRIR